MFAWLWLRDRAVLGDRGRRRSALAAFCVLAAAGLPILGRYLLLPATIGAILCGAGAFGWIELPRGDSRRRPWAWFGVLTLVLLVAFTPARSTASRRCARALDRQDAIQDDLRALVESPPGLISARCRPIAVPNHRPVPLLALWLDLPPQQIRSLQNGPIARGDVRARRRRRTSRTTTSSTRATCAASVPAAAAGLPARRRQRVVARLRAAAADDESGPCTLRRGGSAGACAGAGLRPGESRYARRGPLKAASFRT